ncbi:hypothetical protein [Thiolapillus sp.]
MKNRNALLRSGITKLLAMLVLSLVLLARVQAQAAVGLHVAGDVRFPDMGVAVPQDTPLCINVSDGTLGVCAQISGIRNIAWVAPEGGDYSSPMDAMSNLSSWCGVPGATNRCLIRLAPGIYDLGTQVLEMQPFVDIQGSGIGMTTIKGEGSAAGAALVQGASDSMLSQLKLEYTSVAAQATAAAYRVNGTSRAKLQNVAMQMRGDAVITVGVLLTNAHGGMVEQVQIHVDASNQCMGLQAEGGAPLKVANRIQVTTGSSCYQTAGMLLNNAELAISNSVVDVEARISVIGVLIDGVSGFPILKGLDISTQANDATNGQSQAVWFKGSAGGLLTNSVAVAESASSPAWGVQIGSAAARLLHNIIHGDTAPVIDNANAVDNCRSNYDAVLNLVSC